MLFSKSTGHFYVGSGILKVRKATHLRDLKAAKHWNKTLQAAFNEANGDMEFFSVEMSSRKEALAYEQHMLDYFWGDVGFCNWARYVETPTLGLKHSPDRCQQIRENNFKMWSDPNHKAKVCTPEAIRKRLESRKGKKYTRIYRPTLEVREKMKKAMKEHCQSPIVRERLIKQSRDYFSNLTPEQRQARSEKQRQITLALAKNEEYRQKVSAGVKASWTDERRVQASRIGKEISNREEVKELRRANTTALWQTSDYRDKVVTRITEYANRPDVVEKRRQHALQYFNRPEVRQATSERVKQMFDDPEHREKNRVRMQGYNAERSKGVIVDGVQYSSLREASRLSGVARSVIKKGLTNNNPRFQYAS